MLSATADALRQRLLEAFPPDRPYRRADLAAEPMPPMVAHYLEHLLDERLRRHAQFALSGPFDADSVAVRSVRERFLRALYTAAQFHADEWEAALSEAADRSVTYLVRPARVLAAAVFERQRGTLPLPAVLKRMERFAGHDYFVEGVSYYAAEPDSDPEIDDVGFAKLLVQIDTYVAERRSARGWVDSARPFLALARLFPDDPGIGARLLQTFFEPRLPLVAERLEDERFGLDEARLFTLLTDAGLPPDPPGDEPFADDDARAADVLDADADTLPAVPVTTESLGFQLVEDFDLDVPDDADAELPTRDAPAELAAPEELPDEEPIPYEDDADDLDEPARPRGDGHPVPASSAPTERRPTLSLVPPPVEPADEPAAPAAAEPPEEAATPETAKAALEGDAVPLWQRFAKEPGSAASRPTPPAAAPAAKPPAPPADEGDVWPPHARPADPTRKEEKIPAPLWRQFLQKRDRTAPDAPADPDAGLAKEPAPAKPLPAAAAALSSPPPAASPAPAPPPAAAPRSLDDDERAVLGPQAAGKRAWFVTELFRGDEAAYADVLRRLSGVGSWDEAWRVIGAEVFRKHRVNIYGPAAVAFTDAVEARHKARAGDA